MVTLNIEWMAQVAITSIGGGGANAIFLNRFTGNNIP